MIVCISLSSFTHSDARKHSTVCEHAEGSLYFLSHCRASFSWTLILADSRMLTLHTQLRTQTTNRSSVTHIQRTTSLKMISSSWAKSACLFPGVAVLVLNPF